MGRLFGRFANRQLKVRPWTSAQNTKMADSKLEWLDGPPMREERYLCAAAVHGGKLVVVGGYEGYNYLSSVAVLDLATNEWSDGPSMRQKRSGCASGWKLVKQSKKKVSFRRRAFVARS